MLRLACLLAGLGLLLTACGGGSTPPTSTALEIAPPNLHAFLKLPPATPSACPTTENGTTVGRQSPWVGRVDVSIFLKRNVSTHQVLRLGNDLRSEPLVNSVYFESAHQAYEEFQRLYACWASVAPSATPASYRLILVSTATLAERNLLIERLYRAPGVGLISCDPSAPCTNLAAPNPTPATSTSS